MIVGSPNNTVYSYVATSLGETSVKYSRLDGAKSYCFTMEFIKTADFYNREISVRAYAKLKDGTYVYSDINVMSVYRIANALYKNVLMSNMSGHDYLYNNILTVVNPNYEEVSYRGRNTIVTAMAEENTTVKPVETTVVSTIKPEETEKEPETTKKEETDTSRTVKNPGVQVESADSEVASNILLNRYISGIDTEFSSTEGNTSSNEGIEKLFDNDLNGPRYNY
jgi:hypothetical protein